MESSGDATPRATGRGSRGEGLIVLRIALLTYRGDPHSGGQGIYVRYLSRALCELGHRVEVLSGQPYPELDDQVTLSRVPSLDLYRPDDPFRRPRRDEFRDAIDVLEFAAMCTAAFPEPLTFSLRAARLLHARRDDFDVVHDNQCLGYGLLGIKRSGLPVLATVHHPIAIDRRLELSHARGVPRRLSLHRWYSFVRMQGRVARRLDGIVTVSQAARTDIVHELKVPRERIDIVPNGVDVELFRPLTGRPRRRGRIITVASANGALKGMSYLLEAIAKLSTERDVELVVVGAGCESPSTRDAIASYGLGSIVRLAGRVDPLRLVELYSEAELAVVPSLYEGFSMPAAEAMACGVPLVATTAGALPEVVGEDGGPGLLVPPGDTGALAAAIARTLDDHDLRRHMSQSARRRVLHRFTWRRAARAMVDRYLQAMEPARRRRGPSRGDPRC